MYYVCNHYQLRYSTIIYYTSKNGTVVASAISARGVGAVMTSISLASFPSLFPLPPAGSRDPFQRFPLPVPFCPRVELAARAMRYRMITKVLHCGKSVHTVTRVNAQLRVCSARRIIIRRDTSAILTDRAGAVANADGNDGNRVRLNSRKQ